VVEFNVIANAVHLEKIIPAQKVVSNWIFGAVIAVIGLAIRLGGHWLARTSVGPDAWTTDPNNVQNYEGVGTIIFIFGLLLFAWICTVAMAGH